MSKILLVEDDAALGAALEFSLVDEGFEIRRAVDLQAARSLFQEGGYSVVLLDVNLPDGSGYDFCKELRAVSSVPVIFLTALDEEVNIVMGLELGANDYITKPFGVRELVARIKVQLRAKPETEESHVLCSDGIRADMSGMNAWKENAPIPLTALEFKLLALFLQNPDKLLKRETILDHISGSDGEYFDENTLSVYIRRLREKIGDDAKNPRFILTKRGLGYQWNAEVKKL